MEEGGWGGVTSGSLFLMLFDFVSDLFGGPSEKHPRVFASCWGTVATELPSHVWREQDVSIFPYGFIG